VTHRRDVDGLRGIAVLLVICYHAQISFVPAGYVGVDMFFVISGFVITGLLVSQIDRNEFNLLSFYYRRTRRLIPALLVMMAAALTGGLFILGPHDLETLAGSAIAVLLLGANLFFWGRQGYFEAQVPEQPLLHMWSLGLEEQFYILFPLVLRALARTGRRTRLIAIGAGTMASFTLSIWLTGRHPGAAFYLPPSRAWEFLLGSLIIAVPQRDSLSPITREIAGGIGLAGILLASMGLSRTTPYPGVAALLPTAGTAAIIWANCSGATIVGQLLRSRAMVAIGLMSYSLYLWHWPAFTLARDYFARALSPVETIMVLGLVFALAYVSWRWLEQMFRVPSDAVTPTRSMQSMVALGTFVAAGTIVILAHNGFPRRLPPAALTFDGSGTVAGDGGCHHGPPELVAEAQLCEISAPLAPRTKVMLWGDSHANSISNLMARLGSEQQIEVWQASYSSCPPVLGLSLANMGASHHCREFNDMTLNAIRRLGIERVLLVAFWSTYIPERRDSYLERLVDIYTTPDDLATGNESRDIQNFSVGIRRTIKALKDLGIEVWILRQIPAQKGFVPMMLARAAIRGKDISDVGISLSEHRRSQDRIDLIFSGLENSVTLVDPAVALCKAGWCSSSNYFESYYRDSNHLTQLGASLLRPQLGAIFH
jgi:peptidoglycan/LPS O-acetylase OafA/YrhL